MTTPDVPSPASASGGEGDTNAETERWRVVRALVDAALELPPPDRAAFLTNAGVNPSMRADAERWLDGCEQSGDFLARPVAERAAPLLPAVGAEPLGPEAAAGDEPLAALRSALAEAYALEREIGRGGMATVYLARDLRHRRSVAVKVLHAELGATLGTERFLREIELTAGLQHPHILPLFDSGAGGGRLYYVMPYVEGETLRSRLVRERRLPVREVTRLLREVASALAHAHRHGVIHRDIKPENVLLAEDGHALVADFGIARAVRFASAPSERGTSENGGGAVALTDAGASPGTPAYMAPEQARRDVAVDQRTDLYSLGVVAYEALAGAHPFGPRTPAALLDAHLRENPPPIGAHRPDVPPALASLVMRLLAKDPAARPQNADEVLSALDDLAELPRAPSRLGRRAALAAAVLLIVTGIGTYGAWRARKSTNGSAAATTRAEPGGALRPAIRAVAVLPFVNTGGVAADDYLSSGLTDELAHALARLPGMRVAGRTSSYAFVGTSTGVQEIGRALGVNAVVAGTLRRAGGELRVTTQLVSAADGLVLWDSVFESRTRDVFALQDELTRAITVAVAPALGDDHGAAPAGRGTGDLEAYDLYLEGRYYWLQRGEANIARSIDYFRQALSRDRTFARAQAGLALAYGVLPVYAQTANDSAVALTAASAERALALDSTLADARLALGLSLDMQMRFPEAQAQYRKALALEPSSVTAHHFLGFSLLNVGRTNEALVELRHATELDPLATAPASAVATALLFARRFPEARLAARRTLALDSTFAFGFLTLGLAQALDGQPDSAVSSLERSVRLHPGDSGQLAALLFAYAAAGRWGDAQRVRALLRRPGGDTRDGADAGLAELVFGEQEPLVRLLTSPEAQRRRILIGRLFGCDPLLDPLWADARFRAAMRRISVQVCPLARAWPIRPPTHS